MTLYWHIDPDLTESLDSYLTGRKVIRNKDATRFYIPASWSVAAINSAYLEWAATLEALRIKDGVAPASLKAQKLIAKVNAVTSIIEFGDWLNEVFSNRTSWTKSEGVSRAGGQGSFANAMEKGWKLADSTWISRFLVACWNEEALVFPTEELFPRFQLPAYLRKFPIWDQISILEGGNGTLRRVYRTLPLRYIGVRSLLDYVPDVINPQLSPIVSDPEGKERYTLGFSKSIVAFQQAHTATALKHTVKDYVTGGEKNQAKKTINGFDFKWYADRDRSLETWCKLGADYILTLTASKLAYQDAMKIFFKHLLENPELPRDPVAYLDSSFTPPPLPQATNVRNINRLVRFIDWVMNWALADIDERSGDRIRLPGLRNPFKIMSPGASNPETQRQAMPLLLVEKAIEILTENDWAWARSLQTDGKRVGGDWYRKYDSATGEWKLVWSPVRAIAMYVKLRTVFRTFQIRHLDSGESDNQRFECHRIFLGDHEENCYRTVPNAHPLAGKNPKRPVEKGALQVFFNDQTGRNEPFLRINTNKTADQAKDSWEKGYDCPWAPDDVVEKLLWLRDWQEQHNPALEIIEWKNVAELDYKKTAYQLQGLRGCFLFRDPAGKVPQHPLTDGKLVNFWFMLCDEVEQRLKAEGFTSSNGRPLQLVLKRTKAGVAQRVQYDLHSLRVTMITALYKGGLPPKVIMLISGHATVPMCLYYAKYRMAEVRHAALNAEAKSIKNLQQEYNEAVKEQELRSMKSLLAYNDEFALQCLADSSDGLVFMDIGICTANCARCSEGVIVKKYATNTTYGPVPGGRRNCASCRFLVSGPPFVLGLNAVANEKSLAASDIAKRRSDAERRKIALEEERFDARARGIFFEKYNELQQLAEDFDRLTAEIDAVFLELRAVVQLAVQSTEINNKLVSGDIPFSEHSKLAFVVNDLQTIKQQFQDTPEFDMLDRVCQASVFFESTQGNTVDKANLIRARYYDSLLDRHGLPPQFFKLDADAALRAGNSLTELLYLRLGRDKVIDIIEGKSTLQDLGILTESFSKAIERATSAPQPFHLARSGSIPLQLG